MTDFSRWRRPGQSAVGAAITRFEAGARRWLATAEETASAAEQVQAERRAAKAEARHRRQVATRIERACRRYGGAVFLDRDSW